MSAIYIIAVIVIIALFYSLYYINKTPKQQQRSNELKTPDATTEINSTDEFEKENNTVVQSKLDLNTPLERPEIRKHNKWLYPTDNFGKMEKGVVN